MADTPVRPQCCEFVTLKGMVHAVYCTRGPDHSGQHWAETTIAGGEIAAVVWTDDPDGPDG